MKISKKSNYIKKIQAKRIKECMEMYGITGKYIADRLNYTPQHISYVLNGKRNLTVDMAISLANLFNEFVVENKKYYSSETIECHTEIVHYDLESIDYRYLLGEIDHKSTMENFDPPVEKTTDYLFKAGLTALLHHYGYDLKMSFCPDITCFKNINRNNLFTQEIQKMFYDQNFTSEITKIETGETLEFLPCELFQFFQDITQNVLCTIEREFERQKWYDNLNSSSLNQNSDNNIPS